MAVPKRKVSKARRDKRRSSVWKLQLPGMTKCPKCGAELTQRKDDAPESVQNRLDVYEKQTKPLIDFYAEKGLLKNVDGSKPLAEVTEAILAALGSN